MIETIETNEGEINEFIESAACLYSIALNTQTREFKGQTSGVMKTAMQIDCNSVPEFKEQLWMKIHDKLKREVVFDDNGPQWHENISPKEEDLERFVLFYDSKAKRSSGLDKINSITLSHWRSKEIWLYVHIYSMSIANLTLWKKVQKCLIEPLNRDRAGATNVFETNALVGRLKEYHRLHYQSGHINWVIWANRIQSAESHLQERMIHSPPPPDILHLFALAKTSADDTVADVRRNLFVAENVNEGVSSGLSRVKVLVEDILKIQNEIAKLQGDEKTKTELLNYELQIMETQAVTTRSMISSMGQALPTRQNETAFGRREFSQIHDQEDVDHIHDFEPTQ